MFCHCKTQALAKVETIKLCVCKALVGEGNPWDVPMFALSTIMFDDTMLIMSPLLHKAASTTSPDTVETQPIWPFLTGACCIVIIAERFMAGAHLSYSCVLQSMDVYQQHKRSYSWTSSSWVPPLPVSCWRSGWYSHWLVPHLCLVISIYEKDALLIGGRRPVLDSE